MTAPDKYIIGTSGYSFADWVGPFYPPGTKSTDMLPLYAQRFATVEVNYTYYRMPSERTMASLVRRTPGGFDFWVKANSALTHERDRKPAGAFLAALAPLREAKRLAGVLLQFPQSFHRTVENRKYLAALADDLRPDPLPLAVEFRHRSWEHPSTLDGLRDRDLTLVVPDVPDIPDLYHAPPAATNATGYLRLHSRNPTLWYAGAAERYDYSYSQDELRTLLAEWSAVEQKVDRIYAFFNNCHRAQAAQNAEAFRRLLEQIE